MNVQCPSLYQINTRVWLTELTRQFGRPATLDDFPDVELDRLASLGMDWLWFLSVWQTGPTGREGEKPEFSLRNQRRRSIDATQSR